MNPMIEQILNVALYMCGGCVAAILLIASACGKIKMSR